MSYPQDQLDFLRTADEMALRGWEMKPWPKTAEEVNEIVAAVTDRPHSYGTCPAAMAIAALAGFYYVADRLGVTGFQASCADMHFFGKVRGYKFGFRVIDYENLLYPQYDDNLRISPEALLRDDKLRRSIRDEAKKKLNNTHHAHGEVVRHWRKLAAMDGDGGAS